MDIVKEYGFKAHVLLEAGTLWGYQSELKKEYLDDAEIIGNNSDIRLSTSFGISCKYGSIFLSLPVLYNKNYDKIKYFHFSMSQSL